MIDLNALDVAVLEVELEMSRRGVSRATTSKCSAFRSALMVLEAAREHQGNVVFADFTAPTDAA